MASPQDLPQLADILTSSFYPPTYWRYWVYPLLRFSIYEDLKQRLQAAPAHYTCLAAIAPVAPTPQSGLVGTVEVSLRRYSLWSTHRPRHLYLSNLAVREAARRQGIARQLLLACEQTAQSWGFGELYLHVMEDNLRARQVYQQAGYHLYRTEVTLFSLLSGQPRRLLLRKVLS